MRTHTGFGVEELQRISESFEGKRPEEVLRWAFQTFGNKVGLASSFGGASGAVILDMAAKITSDVNVFYLDTDFLFPETYELIKESSQRYGITPVAYKSDLTPDEQSAKHGAALWSRDPDLCCDLRKVQPNRKAMAGLDAWITGIRRDQNLGRKVVGIVEWDEKFGLVKVNPVAHWGKKEVWDYILANNVPYNALLDQGYKSIGCTYCTSPVGGDADDRDGRWVGTDKTECGLHT